MKRRMSEGIDSDERFLANNIIGSGRFRTPRKGLINLKSTDDLVRM